MCLLEGGLAEESGWQDWPSNQSLSGSSLEDLSSVLMSTNKLDSVPVVHASEMQLRLVEDLQV